MFCNKKIWLMIFYVVGVWNVITTCFADDETGNAKAAIDYADPGSWLCRPEKNDVCNSIKDVSIVAADGSVSLQHYQPNPEAGIDCFYVYPTSSEDRTANSDTQPGLEIPVTADQFGQFGTKCRQFAPLYRSITVRALRSLLTGRPLPNADYELPYEDVLNAWRYYLAHDNHGRGIVLIGHSQGAKILSRLIENEIDSKPIQQQLVVAMLAGATVLVPAGKNVGGTFKSIPLCTSADQFGCVIVYSSYRASLPPSIDPPARYGHSTDSLQATCVNPAAPGSSEKVVLDSYFVTGDTTWTNNKNVETPLVRVPGLVSGQCVTHGEYTYLEITVNADSADARTDTIPGDLIINGKPDATWGLHRADVALTMGNLLDAVDRQGRARLTQNAHSKPIKQKKSKRQQ